MEFFLKQLYPNKYFKENLLPLIINDILEYHLEFHPIQLLFPFLYIS